MAMVLHNVQEMATIHNTDVVGLKSSFRKDLELRNTCRNFWDHLQIPFIKLVVKGCHITCQLGSAFIEHHICER
jgi:hypothetical protein